MKTTRDDDERIKQAVKLGRTTTEGCDPLPAKGKDMSRPARVEDGTLDPTVVDTKRQEAQLLGRIKQDVAEMEMRGKNALHRIPTDRKVAAELALSRLSTEMADRLEALDIEIANEPPTQREQSEPLQQQRSPVALSVPGAYPHRGIDYQPANSTYDGCVSVSNFTTNNYYSGGFLRDATEEISPLPVPLDVSASNSALVEAQPVPLSEEVRVEDLEVAEPMQTETEPQDTTRPKANHFTQACILGFPCFFLLTAGLIIFLVGRSNNSSDSNPGYSGTTSPPAGPSAEEYLWSLLPSATQDTIQRDADLIEPQSKAYQWMVEDPNLSQYSDKRLLQRYALGTFYYATDGPNWKHKGGSTETVIFLVGGPGSGPGAGHSPESGTPPADNALTQPGARTSPHGLGGRSLQPGNGPSRPAGGPPGGAPLPPTSPRAVNITKAQWMDYESHECEWFTMYYDGNICPQDNDTITKLSFLQNDLAGSLPEELSLLSSLWHLNLHHNKIGGQIPSKLPQSLAEMFLQENQLTGTIPSQISLLSNTLRLLQISNNQLTGRLPKELWRLVMLNDFKAGRNSLSFTIPTALCDLLPNLRVFMPPYNQLNSSIPTSIGRCKDLVTLNIRSNQMTGRLPTELGQMMSVEDLGLSYNNLTGTIPTQLGLLQNIQRIQLDGNAALFGSIPSQLGLLNGTLVNLNLEGTAVTGTIPSGLCGIPRLNFNCSLVCGCRGCPCKG